jgi:hypothetical protein
MTQNNLMFTFVVDVQTYKQFELIFKGVAESKMLGQSHRCFRVIAKNSAQTWRHGHSHRDSSGDFYSERRVCEDCQNFTQALRSHPPPIASLFPKLNALLKILPSIMKLDVLVLSVSYCDAPFFFHQY